MKGFGTGVGGFSNTATCMYAMAAIFDKPGHEDQYNEIMTRIKLLREIVGQEIDRIKGADKPSLPKEWRQLEKITSEDTPEQILAKMRQNAMVVSKKPYFFRYLYPDKSGAYSWWSYRFNARKNNAGWRIDYFIVSDRLKEKIKGADIWSEVLGSDHCPVVLELED